MFQELTDVSETEDVEGALLLAKALLKVSKIFRVPMSGAGFVMMIPKRLTADFQEHIVETLVQQPLDRLDETVKVDHSLMPSIF